MNRQTFTIIALLVTGFYGWAKELGIPKELKILIATITGVGLAFLETVPFYFDRVAFGLAIAFSVAGLTSVPEDLVETTKKTVAKGKSLLGGKRNS